MSQPYVVIWHQYKLIKMRAELASLNHCAVPFFKPRHRQLVLVLLLYLSEQRICIFISLTSITKTCALTRTMGREDAQVNRHVRYSLVMSRDTVCLRFYFLTNLIEIRELFTFGMQELSPF